MSSYFGDTVQTSKKTVYDTGQPCAFGTCSISTAVVPCKKTDGIDDWLVERQSCVGGFCPMKNVCAAPDSDECFLGTNSKGEDPRVSVAWNVRAPKIRCEYSRDRMNDLQIIQAYRDRYGTTADYDKMMNSFCLLPGNACAIDPLTGKPFVSCSKINASDDEGRACRQWFGTQSDAVRDDFIKNYCFSHDSSPDCKCVNRESDKIYTTIKPRSPFNDACWYSPCASEKYLVPSSMKSPSCPANFCQIIYENLQNNNVDINNVKNSISCTFTPGGGGEPPVVPPEQPTTGPNTNLMIAVGAAAIVVVSAIVSLSLGNKKN